jgi:hypothetical protein
MSEIQDKPQKPENYLLWAILSTILCCLPFGIVSIVYSTQVDSLYFNGQYEAAAAKSKSAKTWAIVSAVSALVFVIIYLILVFAVGLTGFLNGF